MSFREQLSQSMRESQTAHDADIDWARRLPRSVHWALCAAVSLIGFLIENHASVWDNPVGTVIWCAFGGWVLGVLSRWLLVPLLPQPYAWLAKRLGLLPRAA